MSTAAAITRYVVLGGGHAGARAIDGMRTGGFGGEIVLIGEEAHLPYERPRLSKDLLLESAATLPPIFDEAHYGQNNVTLLRNSRAVRIDRLCQYVELTDGRRVAYDKLLIATGSRLRRLDIAGITGKRNLFYLRTIEDSRAIERRLRPDARVLVIGGGFIGLEVAACARRRAGQVIVIEAGPQTMGRAVPVEVAAFVEQHHRSQGVDIRVGLRPVELEGADEVHHVRLSSGERLQVDLVVVGIGVTPAAELAEECGLAVRDGILTDERGATSDPQIYAAGDVTRHFNSRLNDHRRLESWHNAQEQGSVVGRVMSGDAAAAYTEVPWFWSDQGDLNLQLAGAPPRWTHTVTRGHPDKGSFTLFQLDTDRLVGAIAVNRAADMPGARRLLAAQVQVD
ncbi:MAG: NAD(P)/FAD-dependent oxidoreductase, partial [Steroidobacteraceae bacterium]